METIANRIANYLDADRTIWSDIDRMRMVLGIQVLLHNIIMVGTILFAAKITGTFWETVILLTAYGVLKMEAGGVHFKKSSACLLGTGIFVEAGVVISRQLNLNLIHIALVYAVCLIVLAIIGPQGTENNPISEKNYEKLRKRTVCIVTTYLIVTIFMAICFKCVPYLLFVAVIFETLSLLPSYIKNTRSS